MKFIMLVFGTRPEAIKMCPLVRELRGRGGFRVITAVSGQHRELLTGVLDAFEVTPDHDLAVMEKAQGLPSLTSVMLEGYSRLLKNERPDLLLVHGDTTTAFSAALAGFYEGICVGHVEAGLRTYNVTSPFPEEFNRHTIGLMAKYHFAPTRQAAENLLGEGIEKDRIFVTGNTGIDALRYTVRDDYRTELSRWAETGRLVLLTLHRRESRGKPMRQILEAVSKVSRERKDLRILFPAHPGREVRLAIADVLWNSSVRVTEPLAISDFHNLLARSEMVLTDSGGIQEEAAALGIPTLVLRDRTERPEGIEAGGLLLAGTDFDSVYRHFSHLCDSQPLREKMKKSLNPYGDGFASARIADILEKILLKTDDRLK